MLALEHMALATLSMLAAEITFQREPSALE
jgi:hypothetical protein